jgi:hypothetical protein
MDSEWDDLDTYDKTAYKMVKRELEKEMTMAIKVTAQRKSKSSNPEIPYFG